LVESVSRKKFSCAFLFSNGVHPGFAAFWVAAEHSNLGPRCGQAFGHRASQHAGGAQDHSDFSSQVK
jgi:hypothetical protein